MKPGQRKKGPKRPFFQFRTPRRTGRLFIDRNAKRFKAPRQQRINVLIGLILHGKKAAQILRGQSDREEVQAPAPTDVVMGHI